VYGESGRSVRNRRATTDQEIWGFMTVAEGLLLAVSVVVFIYLGIAMFKPDRF
jgi:K+-transporting ATPase KdpF subunit